MQFCVCVQIENKTFRMQLKLIILFFSLSGLGSRKSVTTLSTHIEFIVLIRLAISITQLIVMKNKLVEFVYWFQCLDRGLWKYFVGVKSLTHKLPNEKLISVG